MISYDPIRVPADKGTVSVLSLPETTRRLGVRAGLWNGGSRYRGVAVIEARWPVVIAK